MIKPGRVTTAAILTLDGTLLSEGIEPASVSDRATDAAIDIAKSRKEDVILIDDDGVWQIDHTGQKLAQPFYRSFVWIPEPVEGFSDDDLIRRLDVWLQRAPCYFDTDPNTGEVYEVLVEVRAPLDGQARGLYEEDCWLHYLGDPGGRPVPDGLRALTDDAFAAVCAGVGGAQ